MASSNVAPFASSSGSWATLPETVVRPPNGVATTRPIDPDATRLILIRHGEAATNSNGIIGGRKGCTGLTERGHDQVRELARVWDALTGAPCVRAWYTSPLLRAQQTADLLTSLTGADSPPIVVEALCELDPGSADAVTWSDYLARGKVPDWDRDPTEPFCEGGESWTGFFDRVEAGLNGLVRAHVGERIAAVTHAGVIEAAMSVFFTGGVVLPRLRLPSAHASITEWEHGEGGWRLLAFNRTAVG